MASDSKHWTRRNFMASSGKAAAGLTAASVLASRGKLQAAPAKSPTTVTDRVLGANGRINMAIIGTGGRGGGLLSSFAKIPNVHIKTICDIDENVFPKAVKKVKDAHGYAPGTEWDMRKVFADPDIDAVAIAAPNHWHALATIWACQAGKHVYVEKPSSHNVWEGRKMIEASRKYDRLVQVGFQNRSIQNVRKAMRFLHDGGIGEVYMAKGMCYKPRNAFKVMPDSEPPAGVHYDMWVGPADYYPYNEGKFHYQWHWHWNTGNGDIGNQGPHQYDVARWGINKNEHPVKVRSFGGYYKFTEQECTQETANTQHTVYEYADGKLLQFEVRGLYTNGESTVKNREVKIGNLFYGTEGWMSIDGSTWKTYMGRKNEPGPSSTSKDVEADPMNLTGAGGDAHFYNFIDALRSGKREDQTCDIEVGHMSTVLPHLGNISYRLGRELTFNGKKERFVGDSKANKMLTRKYRKGYAVPKKV